MEPLAEKEMKAKGADLAGGTCEETEKQGEVARLEVIFSRQLLWLGSYKETSVSLPTTSPLSITFLGPFLFFMSTKNASLSITISLSSASFFLQQVSFLLWLVLLLCPLL